MVGTPWTPAISCSTGSRVRHACYSMGRRSPYAVRRPRRRWPRVRWRRRKPTPCSSWVPAASPPGWHVPMWHCDPLRRVLIWGRRPDRADALAETVRSEWQRETPDIARTVQVIDSLEQGCRAAQIISCATTATEPVVQGHGCNPAHMSISWGVYPSHARSGRRGGASLGARGG